jgi:hypothetical protein
MAAVEDADLERGIIITLRDIMADPILKLAHGIWQSSEAQLKNRIANHKSRLSNLTNEIYQLLGFASAFQGLLLTAVAQATQLKCRNVGIPLALSLFATVFTLVGVWQKKGIITKLKRTLSIEDRVRQVSTVFLSITFVFLLFSLSILRSLQLSQLFYIGSPCNDDAKFICSHILRYVHQVMLLL